MQEQTTLVDRIRQDSSEATEIRRKIAAFAALGMIDFSMISLFQMGYIKKLPDLPGKIFDSEKVNTAKEAVLLGVPDGVVSIGGYAATMILAMAASRYKKQSRLLDVALGGVLLGQAAGAAQYMVNMTTKQKKICVYCVAGALLNFTSLFSLRRLFKRRD